MSNIRQIIQRAVGGIEDDDPVIFDPRIWRRPGPPIKNVDPQNLGLIELDKSAMVVVPSFEDTKSLVRSEKQAMANLTAKLENSAAEPQEDINLKITQGAHLRQDTKLEQNVEFEQEASLEEHKPIQQSKMKVPFWTAKPQSTPNTNSKPASQSKTKPSLWTTNPQTTAKTDRKPGIHHTSANEQETFLVELWRNESTGLPRLTPEVGCTESDKVPENNRLGNRKPVATFLKTLRDIFGKVPSDPWPGPPIGDILKKYFPWCNDKQVCLFPI